MRLSLLSGDRRAALRSPIPWIALGIPFVATILVWLVLSRGAAENASVAFERRTLSAEAAMGARLRGYERMLAAGAAFAGTSKDLTRAQWAEFVGRLNLGDAYPGVQTMGYAERVRRADRDQHVKRVRAEGPADYDIRPPGERDDYVVIVYSEPYKGRNERVVGLDTYSQPVLRAAIDRAFKEGEASITEKVMVPVEDAAGKERAQPGFVMYVPVFRAGMPLKTLEQRDAALLGFVFGTIRVDQLAAGVLDRGLARALDMKLYDGAKVTSEALLGDVRGAEEGVPGGTPVFQRTGVIDVGGRKWSVAHASRPEFDARAQDAIGVGLLGFGLLASLGMFAFTLVLVASGKAAGEASLRDPLTQLFNRGYLDETMANELQRARRSQQPVGLIVVDIDGFKAISDSGKGVGDLVLRQFGRLLELNTRDSDIKCRYGLSEFAVGMPGATIENARTRAERLREVLEVTAIEHGGKSLGVITLSAGVAAYPRDGEDWGAVAKAAHRALYAAKSAGRNRVAAAESASPAPVQ